MNYQSAGFVQISSFAQGLLQGEYETIAINDIISDQAGYLLAYLSNENTEAVNIHFDDFTVTHSKTNVVQAVDYYPFGAVASSYTRTAADPTKYLYNAGAELNDVTGYYETFFRNYDATIGRFNGVDVMAGKYSSQTPYNYAFNDPVALNDPSGADPYDSDCPECNYNYGNGAGYDSRGFTQDDVVFGIGARWFTSNLTGSLGRSGAFDPGSGYSVAPGGANDWGNQYRSASSNLAFMTANDFRNSYGITNADGSFNYAASADIAGAFAMRPDAPMLAQISKAMGLAGLGQDGIWERTLDTSQAAPSGAIRGVFIRDWGLIGFGQYGGSTTLGARNSPRGSLNSSGESTGVNGSLNSYSYWRDVSSAVLAIFSEGFNIRNFERPKGMSIKDFNASKSTAKTISRRLGALGVALSVTDMAVSGVNKSNSLDTAFGLISFAGAPGAVIGGVYFGANLITIGISGRSIGEHADDYIWVSTGFSIIPISKVGKHD